MSEEISNISSNSIESSYLVTIDQLKNGKEYTDLKTQEDGEIKLLQYVKNKVGWQNKEILGLHWGMNGSLRPSHFVGAVWLDCENKIPKVPLIVKPKIESVDAVKMFTDVAAHDDLFGNYGALFECYPEQPPIGGNPLENLSLLQVAIYLKRLALFCRKDLRFGYIRVNENLTGKIKGKILIGTNLRRNSLRGRLDRIFCQYQLFSMDTVENQILKYALWISIKLLAKYRSSVPNILWQWAKQCEAALASVSLRLIKVTDFHGLIYSGFMKRYKEPHTLAKMIIRRFRVNAEGDVDENKFNNTVPFYLDMDLLFEIYVGVKLREMGLKISRSEYQPTKLIKGNGFELTIKPDYVTADGQVIVDAKYKALANYEDSTKMNALYSSREDSRNIWEDKYNLVRIVNSDIYQVIAYANLLPQSHKSLSWPAHAVLAIPIQNKTTTNFKDWEDFQKDQDVPHLTLKLPGERQIRLSFFLCPLAILKREPTLGSNALVR